MNIITSKKSRNFRVLTLRCGFFSIECQSYITHEKIIENMKEKSNGKIVRKNTKYKIEKIVKRNDRKIVEKNMKIENRKLNGNNIIEKKNMKIENVSIGLKIVEQIVRIGSALSGLLPSKYVMFRRALYLV